VRGRIPGWDSLLFIYGSLVIPVILAILIGINLTVWTWTRINYIFIFGEPALPLLDLIPHLSQVLTQEKREITNNILWWVQDYIVQLFSWLNLSVDPRFPLRGTLLCLLVIFFNY